MPEKNDKPEREKQKAEFGPLVKANQVDETGRIVTPGLNRPDGIVPEQRKIPDVNALKSLSRAELIAELQEYGVIDPWDDIIADAEQYVTRFSKFPPNSLLFDLEVQNVLGTYSKRGLVGLNRRTHERYTTMIAIGGDPARELIRISEGDENVCEQCRALEGTMGTLAEHRALGLPGSQSCLGGDYCRCTLMRIE